FDVLRDKVKLQQIVEELGGEWSAVGSDQSIISASLDQQREAPQLQDVRQRVDAILSTDGSPDGKLSVEQSAKSKTILRTRTGWDEAKRSGAGALGSGDATKAWQR